MKRITYLLFFVSIFVFSQDDSSVKNESLLVDEQIWTPFKESYASGNAEVFNNLHTDDVKRITTSGIQIGEAYKESNTKWLSNPNRRARSIDFRFEHRIYTGNNGYEVGYYRIAYPMKDGETGYTYARFSVLLRKVEGVWKIAQDWDTNSINGVPVTADDFDRLK